MPKRKYDRIFMLLNGINDGLGANINGSCDIEIIDGRGKLKVYIGGIGRLKDKQRTFYLICRGSDNSTAVPVGSVERNGLNAVLEKNFDPDNMFGSGKSVGSVNAAAVWEDGEGPSKAILEGFVSQRTDWKNGLETPNTKHQPDGNIIKTPAVNKSESEKKSSIENNIESRIESKLAEYVKASGQISEAKPASRITAGGRPVHPDGESVSEKEASPHDTFRAMVEKFKSELKTLDEMGFIDKSAIYPAGDEAGQKSEENGGEDSETDEKSTRTAAEWDKLFEKSDRLDAGGGTVWVRTDQREMYMLPSAAEDLRRLFVKNGARAGRHLLAGKNGGSYYIGVPGTDGQRETAQENGFYDFLPVGDGNAGYWIKELPEI
ncbi:MAG TPA: hypothetical protein H9688_09480 [Firmicutes bacterium]|nr:hypothetical protein [Bacillota bacterium]